MAARAVECAEAAEVAGSGGVQVNVPETVAAAATHLMGSGLGQILAIPCVWEVVKALVARVLRQNKDMRSTEKRKDSQEAATATNARKTLNGIGGRFSRGINVSQPERASQARTSDRRI